ncbi:MAG: hypothetical protein WDN24_12750 [Sphingomonas sp.]
MSEHIHEVASEVSPLVQAAEEAMEDAVIAIANLMAGAVAKRREAGILPAEAQPALLLLHRALTSTIEGNSSMLRVHGKLEEQYRTLAADDVHPFTLEAVQRTAVEANRQRRRKPLKAVA